MGKHIIERKTTSDNFSYLVDNKTFLCQHKTFHPLTAKKKKWISEKMHRDLENIIQKDSHRYITPERNQGLSTQKLINCEIEYDLFCC